MIMVILISCPTTSRQIDMVDWELTQEDSRKWRFDRPRQDQDVSTRLKWTTLRATWYSNTLYLPIYCRNVLCPDR